MSDDRRDTQRRRDDGELVLDSQVAFLERKSGLGEVLEQHRQPRRRQDVKERLVAQWKQTLALSSASARKLVTDLPPAPRPAARRTPPRPPNPLRNPGRTVVSRVRREPVVEAAPEPVVEPAPEPAVEAAPEPVVEPAPEPAVEAAPEPVAEPVVEAAPELLVQAAPQPPEPTPSRWFPTLPSLPKRIAEVAVQTAGTVLLILAVKAGTVLASLATPPPQ
jgi:hypothetical protein